jgi:sugar/nucleoside kinase (ribokinase family)
MERKGITAGGNWIVDRIKTVDCLPSRGMLANIHGETRSPGGAPANVLANLARLEAPFHLGGIGVIGSDADGQFILDRFRQYGVDLSGMVQVPQAVTSYTDVMSEETTGNRTFFHHRGANALFGPEHIPLDKLSCRIFHLGYLLLLDTMDKPDPDYGTVAARTLHAIQQRGIKTSLDVVSEEGDRFQTIVPPALKYVDYLILNEIETGRIVGRPIRRADGTLDVAQLQEAVEALHGLGRMELVVVHMPEGTYLQDRHGKRHSAGSLELPKNFIVSSVGAGDAFCTGMLYGLHERWDYTRATELANGCAAASLSAAGASDGVRPLAEVLELGRRFERRKPPVDVA